MVGTNIGASGVICSRDTQTGFKDVIFTFAAYRLGENMVQVKTDPDGYDPDRRNRIRWVNEHRLLHVLFPTKRIAV